MLSNREIEAMYARPTSKQNQIGIPITIPQTTNKINMDTLQQLRRNSQNCSQDVPKMDQTKETHTMVSKFHTQPYPAQRKYYYILINN